MAMATTAAPGAWTTEWFGCLEDLESFLLSCCCPCIQAGRNIEIITKGTTECMTGGLIYCLIQGFTGCGCLYMCTFRKDLREQYSLPEQPCNDILFTCCCPCCAIAQEGRELKNRGMDPAKGYAAVSQFQSQGAAVPQPPPAQAMYK